MLLRPERVALPPAPETPPHVLSRPLSHKRSCAQPRWEPAQSAHHAVRPEGHGGPRPQHTVIANLMTLHLRPSSPSTQISLLVKQFPEADTLMFLCSQG